MERVSNKANKDFFLLSNLGGCGNESAGSSIDERASGSSEGLSPDSSAYQEMTGTLQRLEKLLRDLQPIARTLGEQPNALIFDRRDSDDPLPRAPK